MRFQNEIIEEIEKNLKVCNEIHWQTERIIINNWSSHVTLE